MQNEYSGKTLSMSSQAVYQGTYTHNGILQNLHENNFTAGYSSMKEPDGTVKVGGIPFGNAVFMDGNVQENVIYAEVPTVTDAIPVFAGINVRMADVASGQPVNNDRTMSYNKGTRCIAGFVNYKTAYKNASDVFTLIDFEDVRLDSTVYATTDGKIVVSGDKPTNGFTIGKIVQINPDSKQFTVYVTPVIE